MSHHLNVVDLMNENERLRAIAAERMDLFKQAATKVEELQLEIEKVRNAGNQALRQWKMYADMTDGADDFEKSAEGSVYRACKELLAEGSRI
jgi:hypothetical protein